MASTKLCFPILRKLGLIIVVIVLGLPASIVFTHGTILIPLIIVMVVGPLALVHYLIWGWWLSPKQEEVEDDSNKLISNQVSSLSVTNIKGVEDGMRRRSAFDFNASLHEDARIKKKKKEE